MPHLASFFLCTEKLCGRILDSGCNLWNFLHLLLNGSEKAFEGNFQDITLLTTFFELRVSCHINDAHTGCGLDVADDKTVWKNSCDYWDMLSWAVYRWLLEAVALRQKEEKRDSKFFPFNSRLNSFLLLHHSFFQRGNTRSRFSGFRIETHSI
jgi:hypothetical protein